MVQILFLSEEAIGMISSIDFSLQHGLGGKTTATEVATSVDLLSGEATLPWKASFGEPSHTPGDKRDIFPNTSIGGGGGYIWENQNTQNRFMVANLH